MASIPAYINLNGNTTSVTITDDGHIFDSTGQPYILPQGITLDPETGNLLQGNQVVGNIVSTMAQNSNTLDHTMANTAGGGAGTTNPPQIIDNGGEAHVLTDTGASAMPGEIPNVTGRRFATASLTDGGARPAIIPGDTDGDGIPDDDTPGDNPPIGDPAPGDENPGGGDGSGAGGDGDSDGDGIPDSLDDTPYGETGGGGGGGGGGSDAAGGDGSGDEAGGGGGGDADGDGIPDELDDTPYGYETGVDNGYPDLEPAGAAASGASKWSSTLGALSMGLSALQALSSLGGKFSKLANLFGEAGKWGTLTTLGKVVGVGGLALGGLGVFSGMMSLGEKFTWGGLMSTLSSAAGYITSLWMLGLMSNPFGWAALGGIAAIGLIMGLKKKDNPLDTANGDVAAMPNATAKGLEGAPITSGRYPSWAQVLPSQSVFMILAGVTSLGIGINLSSPSVMNQVVQISAPQISSVRSQLSTATNKQVPENLLNKVFIKAGDGTTTPDKVVFVTQNGDKGYNVNMVSLNPGGYLMGPDAPGAKMVPFFVVDPQTRSIVPNPLASNALGAQTAMAQAANAPGLSPRGAAAALNNGVMQGNYVKAPN